jgi:MFS family permease
MPSPGSAGAVAARPPNKWLVTVSVSFGTLMGAVDVSIVNVALPHIRGAVGATVQEITWISTGYALALVLVMPLTAFLGRLFGQRRVYLASLALFLVGSALCGTAGSLPTLVAYRALQGFGAGALQPTEQAILRQTFPPREQGMAMAVFGMAVMLGPAIGPSAFEVGDDVRDAFVDADGYAAAAFDPYPGRPDKWLADIYALAALRLQAAGVKAIYGGDLCTVSDPARFFSYRRDRSPGRMAALVWLE